MAKPKTRTYILNGTINARRIKQLIKRIELCESKNINIHLCSDGGDLWMSDIFTDFTHRTDKKLTFIGNGKMASAAINIFMEAKGKKLLHPYTVAMLHLSSVSDFESRDLLNSKSYNSAMLKAAEKDNAEILELYVNCFGLTNDEINIIKNGGDLGIDHERLAKSLPKINEMGSCFYESRAIKA